MHKLHQGYHLPNPNEKYFICRRYLELQLFSQYTTSPIRASEAIKEIYDDHAPDMFRLAAHYQADEPDQRNRTVVDTAKYVKHTRTHTYRILKQCHTSRWSLCSCGIWIILYPHLSNNDPSSVINRIPFLFRKRREECCENTTTSTTIATTMEFMCNASSTGSNSHDTLLTVSLVVTQSDAGTVTMSQHNFISGFASVVSCWCSEHSRSRRRSTGWTDYATRASQEVCVSLLINGSNHCGNA